MWNIGQDEAALGALGVDAVAKGLAMIFVCRSVRSRIAGGTDPRIEHGTGLAELLSHGAFQSARSMAHRFPHVISRSISRHIRGSEGEVREIAGELSTKARLFLSLPTPGSMSRSQSRGRYDGRAASVAALGRVQGQSSLHPVVRAGALLRVPMVRKLAGVGCAT